MRPDCAAKDFFFVSLDWVLGDSPLEVTYHMKLFYGPRSHQWKTRDVRVDYAWRSGSSPDASADRLVELGILTRECPPTSSVDFKLAEFFPTGKQVARDHGMVPVEREGEVIKVAISDLRVVPRMNEMLTTRVEPRRLSFFFEPVLVTPETFKALAVQVYGEWRALEEVALVNWDSAPGVLESSRLKGPYLHPAARLDHPDGVDFNEELYTKQMRELSEPPLMGGPPGFRLCYRSTQGFHRTVWGWSGGLAIRVHQNTTHLGCRSFPTTPAIWQKIEAMTQDPAIWEPTDRRFWRSLEQGAPHFPLGRPTWILERWTPPHQDILWRTGASPSFFAFCCLLLDCAGLDYTVERLVYEA